MSIATLARTQSAFAKALGFTHKKTSCPATLHNLLKTLDVDAVEKTLSQWINKVCKITRLDRMF